MVIHWIVPGLELVGVVVGGVASRSGHTLDSAGSLASRSSGGGGG